MGDAQAPNIPPVPPASPGAGQLKVLFINNYPMDQSFEAWSRGEFPGHHLWGATHLPEYGIKVDILPHEKYAIVNKIGQILKLGDYLDQQVRAFLKSSQYDLVYSACQNNTLFLSILRRMRILRKPIIAIIHHPMCRSRRNDTYVKGHDQLLFLSSSVLKDFENEFSRIGREKVCALEWGVDMPFYQKPESASIPESEDGFIVSAGKSARDHDTLAKAFFEMNYRLRIYCSARSAPSVSNLPSNITVQYTHLTGNTISYPELLRIYAKAYAVAIPLIDTDSMAGLTSLLDAMAMHKAVIMTKNDRIDVDIEREGIGIWVGPGDVRGWHRAVTYLLAHPEEATQMGNRGYRLCETKYNLEIFSSKLASVLRRCAP